MSNSLVWRFTNANFENRHYKRERKIMSFFVSLFMVIFILTRAFLNYSIQSLHFL